LFMRVPSETQLPQLIQADSIKFARRANKSDADRRRIRR
jgi:hypothetical protein